MKTLLTLILLTLCPAFAHAEEVSITADAYTLKGTLQPAGDDKNIAVIQIAGSGPTDRDGNTTGAIGKNDSHKLLSAVLKNKNITTLRFDKRGVAASAGENPNEGELQFDHYVEDAMRWTNFLRERGYKNIILLGHSEGALVATLAAQKTKTSGVILVAGAGRPASVLLREQLKAQLPPNLFRRADLTLKSLTDGNQVINSVPSLNHLFRASVQPYLISWFKYDPAEELAKVKVPVLIVQGSSDLQTTVADAKLMHAKAKGSTLQVIEGMNHVLKKQSGGIKEQMKSYTDPTLPLHPALGPTLDAFIQKLVKK